MALICWVAILLPRMAIAQRSPPTSDLHEESIEPLLPRNPRNEADEDRLRAAAQFAHGHVLWQRGQMADALRQFERAFRHDPSPGIAKEIMALASQLDRHAEAVRYAILSAELEPPDADLSVRLAVLLSEQGEYTRAVRLLEKASQRTLAAPQGLPAIQLQVELMRMYLVTEQPEAAARAADVVRAALETPQAFRLDSGEARQLLLQRDRLDPLIAESFLLVRRYADAESIYRAVQQAQPDDARLRFQFARIATQQGAWQLARQHLNDYFHAKSTAAGTEPYELLQRIVIGATKDESRARTELLLTLRKLLEHDSKNPFLAFYTAEQLVAAGELDAAAKLYVDWMTRQPSVATGRQLAEIYRRQRDAPALLSMLGRTLDLQESGDGLPELSEALGSDAPMFDQLVALLRASTPAGKPAWNSSTCVAVVLLALGNDRIAIAKELYEKVKAAPERAGRPVEDATRVYEMIGLAAALAEQPLFAVEAFQQAIAAQPPPEKLAAYQFYLSGAFAAAGKTSEALVAAEKCAELRRDSALFQARPAWVLYHARQFHAAEKRYREWFERFDPKFDPDEVRDQTRQARLNLSNLCVVQDRLPEAEEWLEQVLDEFPESTSASNDLGYLWADQGKRVQRALRMIQKAVTDDPDNTAFRDSLGWAYYRLGRYHDAVRELELAAAAAPDGVILDHLAEVYVKLGDPAKALAAWRKAVERLTDDQHEAKRLAAVNAKIENCLKHSKHEK